MPRKIIIAGAGAAGLMAAATAAERGLDVLLLEKNDRAGKKLLISGKGRCNITNNTDIEGLIENCPGNGHFLYSSFYSFSNADIIEFFNRNGLATKVERGDRVFPVTDRAKDVVDVLLDRVKKSGVKIYYDTPISDVEITCNTGNTGNTFNSGNILKSVKGVRTRDGRSFECDSLILATGGASYPRTGSTGDGYTLAKKLGHTIVKLRPSLIPLIAAEGWVSELQGLSLRNVEVTFTNNRGKKVYNDFGEMLFTHFGVSGPVILSASRHLLDYDYKDITLHIDLKPALTEDVLDSRIQRDFSLNLRKQFKNSLDDLLPQKLIPVIIKLSGIPEGKPVNQITREERHNLIKLLKNLEITINGSRPIDEAIVTAGGVLTDEINPSTLESKILKGLYFAGEIIDVDAYTGGFNLTIAFSTGHLAGMNC